LVDLVEVLHAFSSEAGCSLAAFGDLAAVGVGQLLLGLVGSTDVHDFCFFTSSLFFGLGIFVLTVGSIKLELILFFFILVLGPSSFLRLLFGGRRNLTVAGGGGLGAIQLVSRGRADA